MKDSGNRTARVLIPVSDSEIAQLKERAAGKPLEDFVRELLLKGKTSPCPAVGEAEVNSR